VLLAARAEGGAGTAPPATPARLSDVAYSGGSDHALWVDPAFGVPCPMLIQWPDRYYHSDLDTPDRCDAASLAHAVRAASTYAAFLAAAGAEEVRWLVDGIARGARGRMLAALRPDRGAEAAHAELERAERALASVARLAYGIPAEDPLHAALAKTLPLAAEQLQGTWDSEIRAGLPAMPLRARRRSHIPVRNVAGLLCPMRWLAPGWDDLSEARQERLLALEASMPGGTTALDVAWFACDGERDLGAIEACVVREGWAVEDAALEEWFEFAVALGFCRWR
jgi:hypothetical protein